ncbi:MAG: RHS repeat-associated core domain-containing protein [Chloroflexota bacterium]
MTFLDTGRENDGGLDYDRARYYSPTLQRFISEDPQGFGGGDPNLYVGNDPTNLMDPDGDCPVCAAVIAGAVIGAGVGGVSAWVSGAGRRARPSERDRDKSDRRIVRQPIEIRRARCRAGAYRLFRTCQEWGLVAQPDQQH